MGDPTLKAFSLFIALTKVRAPSFVERAFLILALEAKRGTDDIWLRRSFGVSRVIPCSTTFPDHLNVTNSPAKSAISKLNSITSRAVLFQCPRKLADAGLLPQTASARITYMTWTAMSRKVVDAGLELAFFLIRYLTPSCMIRSRRICTHMLKIIPLSVWMRTGTTTTFVRMEKPSA